MLFCKAALNLAMLLSLFCSVEGGFVSHPCRFVLFFFLYFGSGAGTFYEFFSFVSHHLGLLLIGIFCAVVGAWYLSKYHNALYLYRKDVQIKEKKAERDPDNPEYAIPLASSYRALALALTSQGKRTEAASYDSKAEEIEQRLRTFYGELNKLEE